MLAMQGAHPGCGRTSQARPLEPAVVHLNQLA